MSATWKEHNPTWYKDVKRKHQSRKHTLKDKIKPLIRHVVFKKEEISSITIENSIYIYGKPLPTDFFHMYGFYSTRRKKFVKRFANRRTRLRIKEWLIKGDYDTTHKNHSLEKSILWEIY